MSNPNLSDIQKLFLEIILPFYQVERDMPLPIPGKRNENDAEHSWSLAVLACSLAKEVDPTLDVGKICMFAVVHDVVEVYAGDTSHWAPDSEHQTKKKREADALKIIKEQQKVFSWLHDTIAAYENKDTPEAQFVYALDKFIAQLIVFQGKGQYYHKNKITKEYSQERLELHRKKAHTHQKVAKYYDELMNQFNEHPEYFHQGLL